MTNDLSFLEVYEVLLIHEDQINLYGGDSGIRSVELEDVNEDLYDMMIQVSGGILSKEEIALILERLSI